MSNNMQKDPTHKCSFTLCRNGCIGMYDAHSQETKLPEECCLESCPFGKCHTGRHGATSVTHFNKCECKCHSPQKEEPKWEERFNDVLLSASTLSNMATSYSILKDFISQEISKAYKEGAKEAYDADIDIALEECKQEVISLCLEKIEGMKKHYTDTRQLGDGIWNRALQTVLDELKGINLTKDKE